MKVVKFQRYNKTVYAVRKWSVIDQYSNLHFGYLYCDLKHLQDGRKKSWIKRGECDWTDCLVEENRIMDKVMEFKAHKAKKTVDYGTEINMKTFMKEVDAREEEAINNSRIERMGSR